MAKVQYKVKAGIFHIGGGRFFYGGKPEDVTDEEVDNLLATYPDLELVEGKAEEVVDPSEEQGIYTKASIKKLSADEQRGVIVEFGGNPEETNNEDERVTLILHLQEDDKPEGD